MSIGPHPDEHRIQNDFTSVTTWPINISNLIRNFLKRFVLLLDRGRLVHSKDPHRSAMCPRVFLPSAGPYPGASRFAARRGPVSLRPRSRASRNLVVGPGRARPDRKRTSLVRYAPPVLGLAGRGHARAVQSLLLPLRRGESTRPASPPRALRCDHPQRSLTTPRMFHDRPAVWSLAPRGVFVAPPKQAGVAGAGPLWWPASCRGCAA